MKRTIVDLLTSKRFVVLIGSLIGVVAVRLNLGLSPEVADELANQILTLSATFIGGVSISDAATAVTMPVGTDHKGRA